MTTKDEFKAAMQRCHICGCWDCWSHNRDVKRINHHRARQRMKREVSHDDE